jgi:hypothetical protein
MADVLEHSLDPSVTLARVNTLLEDNGYAFISFPDIESVESRYMRTLAQSTRRDWFWGCCHIPWHTWEFTRPTAERMFQKAGFEVAGFRRSRGPLPDPAPLSVAMLSSPVRLLGIPAVGGKLGTQMEFVLRKRS